MGAYEEYPSRNAEVKFIQSAIGKLPIIGFCLGSQLLAYALGAKVYPNIIQGKKIKEIGYTSIELTKNGKKSRIFKGFTTPFKALEWHGDIFDLPKDAEHLAFTPLAANQAFSYKTAYGFLFHFEFTPGMVENQINTDKQWIHEDNDIDESLLQRESIEYQRQMKKQTFRLLDNFLS